jgi:hypothetical protein
MANPNRNGAHQQRIPPSGTLRQSQLVSTFGPGALVDLVDNAVLMSGTDFWRFDGEPAAFSEPRLRASLTEMLKNQGRTLSIDKPFRLPPVGDDREPNKARGVQVLEFPSWMVCQNLNCNALMRTQHLDPKKSNGRYFHNCDDGHSTLCVPVRFVAACKHGHIQDFPWKGFAHWGKESCSSARLQLTEGATGDFSQIFVRCVCGEKQPLSTAMNKNIELKCFGNRPWLGNSEASKELCDQKLKLLVRTASNAYFSQIVSALSIPDGAKKVDDAVEGLWTYLEAVETEADLAHEQKKRTVSEGLKGLAAKEVLTSILNRKAGKSAARKKLRTAEFEQFVSSEVEKPGELPPAGVNYFARRLRTTMPTQGVGQVVLARVLREVRAQIGFTRLEAPNADLQGEYDIGVKSAAVGLNTDWLPASEIFGEGIFLRLDEAAVREWEDRPAVRSRVQELKKGYDAWVNGLSDEEKARASFPGGRFYLLHSLSHLLMSAISLECGYGASAIKERLYCASRLDETPMAAILLSTGSSGSEGTLGGLVDQGYAIVNHLRRAFDLGSLCSNDPVCAAHTPAGDLAERFREGAACHGCLFVAECSCERFNQYLDRALVVPTLGNDARLAFFGTRP